MGERPLTNAETRALQKRIDEARERRRHLNSYLAGMEASLQRGTTWQYDPEAFQKICVEVEESARGSREKSEEQEIARYGRVLTREERQGWRRLPPDRLEAVEERSDERSTEG